MKKLLSLFGLAFLFVVGVQAAKVDTVLVRSQVMNKDVKVVTVCPDKMLAGEKCPVVFLLHGHGGHEKTWLEIKPNLPEIADEKGILFVCPSGNRNSWYWDSPVVKESCYETFVSKELV